MGGTLPLLIRSFASSTVLRDRYTAWFYGINTVGAAAGCYVTGFHLLPAIGLGWTNGLAAGIDLVIAAIAIRLGQILASSPGSAVVATGTTPQATGSAVRPIPRWVISAVAALAGCASLILQMVWTRQLALVLGGSTYAFSAVLFTFLIGIALGSLCADLWMETSPTALGGAVVVIGLIVAAALCERSIPQLTYLLGAVRDLRASQPFNGAISVAASAVLELVPALGMGVLFPFFVHLNGGAASEVGNDVGEIYAANTLGAIVGALATPLVIVPTWGSENAFALAVWIYAAIAITLVLVSSRAITFPRLLVAVVTLIIALVAKPVFDPMITNAGMYMYRYLDPVEWKKAAQLRFFREGAVADVLVTRATDGGSKALRVNGKVDATDSGDMPTQLGMAYFPRFLRPDAADVLVIGYGSGTTSGASLLFAGTKVMCAEIEPAVFAASSQFSPGNHNPEHSPRFSISFDDARSYLQETDSKFDLILSEPSNPWMAGVSNLFTTQYYGAVHRRLKPGGLFGQWIQLYSFTPETYAMVVRTVMGVFPHAALLLTLNGDTLLVASDSPIGPTKETIGKAQSLVDSTPEVRADLQKYFSTTNVFSLMFERQILDEEGLRAFVGNDHGPMNTDLNLRLEFDAPRNLYFQTILGVDISLRAAAEPSQFAREFDAWGGDKEQAGLFNVIGQEYAKRGMTTKAAQIVGLGLARSPDRPDLLGARLLLSQVSQAELDAAIPKIVSASDVLANKVGMAMFQAGQYAPAIDIFRRLAAIHPGSAVVWQNLAQGYAAAGQRDKAGEAFQKAISLDPYADQFQQSYEKFKAAGNPR